METEFAEPYNMPRQKLPTHLLADGPRRRDSHHDDHRKKHSLTGTRVRPIMVDATTASTSTRWWTSNWPSRRSSKSTGHRHSPAGSERRPGTGPGPIELLVFDFDGVFTDNRVYVLEDGREAVACNRGDGMGLSMLRAAGLPIVVLSTEDQSGRRPPAAAS